MKKVKIFREKCTNRYIFLYFDIFEKLYLNTAIICNHEGGLVRNIKEKSRIWTLMYQHKVKVLWWAYNETIFRKRICPKYKNYQKTSTFLKWLSKIYFLTVLNSNNLTHSLANILFKKLWNMYPWDSDNASIGLGINFWIIFI